MFKSHDRCQLKIFSLDSRTNVNCRDNNKGKIISIGRVGKPPSTTIDYYLLKVWNIIHLALANLAINYLILCLTLIHEWLNVKRIRILNWLEKELTTFNDISWCYVLECKCFVCTNDDAWHGYKIITHIHMYHMNKKREVVLGWSELKYAKDKLLMHAKKENKLKFLFKPKHVVYKTITNVTYLLVLSFENKEFW